MTHSGLTAVDWTAIGTLALAGVTAAATIVTSVIAATDRRRDDRLRRKANQERDQRETTERRAREDYEARQVVVKPTRFRDASQVGYAGDTFTHRITVSTPNAYPIKQVEGRWLLTGNGNFSIADFGFGVDPPTVEDDRTTYSFRARIPVTDPDAEPIIRFVDWHGNRYYQYRHYTDRFPQNTDFTNAAMKIDKWIRTGPKPD